MKILVAIAALIVIAVAGWIGLRTWYVDTHCTTVLGTQVCSSGSQPAAPAQVPLPQCDGPYPLTACTSPPPTPVPSATAAMAGYVNQVSPGVWEIDCAAGVVQCVPPGRPGAGPYGTTCHFEVINGGLSTVWELCRTPAPSGYVMPPGVTAGPAPGTYYVNCFRAQCTSVQGAGPDGTTCTWPPSTGEQLCR